ncbi:velB [Aspergillus rambellii]|uniref:VelB n=1 Tax=Aspergillus rambellii TaxID=308745 RepID=A0A0F8UGM5_9EURO|nr:velB [Aspergillus rambellii]
MDRIPPPSSVYTTPGSAGPVPGSGIPTGSLDPLSTIHDGRIWSLQVVQQPIRARMCGFGDKVRPYGQPVGYPQMNNYYGGNPQMQYPNPYGNPQAHYYPPYYAGSGMPPTNMSPAQPVASGPGGMFTRNLIGSLSASAFRLTDPDNKIGVWFILQDLSVRTEGVFRLKMSFVNVGSSSSNDASNGLSVINHGSAPVLASVFSEPFQVFSAKKFPGVIESTALSKCFALQGIKIPIRKDGVKGSRGRHSDEDDGLDNDF